MEQIIKKYIQSLKKGQSQKHASEDEVWKLLEEKIDSSGSLSARKRILRYSIITSVAASLLICIFIIGYMRFDNNTESRELAVIELSNESEYIKVISSTGENIELISDKTNYTHNVKEATSDVSVYSENTSTETLITPSGRICKIVLPDGSTIHVNANTSVTYPKVFAKHERRIKVDGEVYCEVDRAEDIPFYVETKGFTVKVLGTKFNVSAYKNSLKSNVVLVSGEVQLSSKGEALNLKPRQMAIFDKDTFVSLRNVETSLYTSWVDGYLILKSKPLRVIFQKIEQFYGVAISCDPVIEEELYTGKLDLTNNVDDILNLIQFSASLKCEKENDTYKISKR